eukprot:m.47615 g.47615  ORF g.47615 m.47615 type:complete len:288 (+) comp11935_c0_seq1:102-965(+)
MGCFAAKTADSATFDNPLHDNKTSVPNIKAPACFNGRHDRVVLGVALLALFVALTSLIVGAVALKEAREARDENDVLRQQLNDAAVSNGADFAAVAARVNASEQDITAVAARVTQSEQDITGVTSTASVLQTALSAYLDLKRPYVYSALMQPALNVWSPIFSRSSDFSGRGTLPTGQYIVVLPALPITPTSCCWVQVNIVAGPFTWYNGVTNSNNEGSEILNVHYSGHDIARSKVSLRINHPPSASGGNPSFDIRLNVEGWVRLELLTLQVYRVTDPSIETLYQNVQ